MGVLEFLFPFYPINTAWVVFSSDLKMDPLNLYPTTSFAKIVITSLVIVKEYGLYLNQEGGLIVFYCYRVMVVPWPGWRPRHGCCGWSAGPSPAPGDIPLGRLN